MQLKCQRLLYLPPSRYSGLTELIDLGDAIFEALLCVSPGMAHPGRVTIGSFLDGFADLIVPVRPYFLWRPQQRDPNDEMVLEAAVNGDAHLIATFNLTDYLPAATRFGIGVERPGNILRRLL